MKGNGARGKTGAGESDRASGGGLKESGRPHMKRRMRKKTDNIYRCVCLCVWLHMCVYFIMNMETYMFAHAFVYVCVRIYRSAWTYKD